MRLFKWKSSALLLATIILICNIFQSIAEESEVVLTNSQFSDSVEAETDPATSPDPASSPPPPVVEDENSKLGRDLFRAASVMLNSSSPDRQSAWDMMSKSSDLGNVDAKVRIAFAKLAGLFFEQV